MPGRKHLVSSLVQARFLKEQGEKEYLSLPRG